jgi:hypothetical protein
MRQRPFSIPHFLGAKTKIWRPPTPSIGTLTYNNQHVNAARPQIEWLCEEVLKGVPHRHYVFSVPKFLRRYFLYDRKLLSDLSRCGWESLKEFFTTVVSEKGAVPGAVIAVQTFGDFLGFHPHLHIL